MQRIKKAYAENGDLKIIPETPPLDGSENWEQGRGAYFELDNDPNTGDPLALDIDREQDNYFKNVISKNIKHWQENSYPNWFDDILYPKNAIVKYTNGNIYVSKVANNTALPTNTTNWTIYDPSNLDSTVYTIETIEDLITIPVGFNTVIVKDINRGGTFVSKTATEIDPNTGLIYAVDNWIVFAKLGGGFWVRQKSGEINSKWLDGISNVSYFGNGTRTSRSSDAVIVVNRNVDDTINSNGHCFSDSSVIDRNGSISYNSFDSRALVNGIESYNHFASFQNGVEFDTSGTTHILYGYVDSPIIKQGKIQNRFGSKIFDITKTGGTIVNNYGVYIDSLINGTNNYAIYTAGDTPSVFEGSITAKSVTSQAVVVTGYSSVTGSISKNTATGLRLQSLTGTTYDFSIMNPAGSAYVLANPTGTSEIRVFGALKPNTDNNITLGGAINKWSTIYAGTGTINTSDDREKTYLEITDAEKQVARELQVNMRKFQFNDAIEKKGKDGARIHFGSSAQTVKSIFEKHGLTAEDYALLCYDEWEDTYEQVIDKDEVLDEDGNIIEEAIYKNGDIIRPAGNRYGIRYDELLCFIISAM